MDIAQIIIALYVMGALTLSVAVVSIVFNIVGIYKMARKVEIRNAWLAFIPFTYTYIFGKIAEKLTENKNNKPIKYGLVLTLLHISQILLPIVSWVLFVLLIFNENFITALFISVLLLIAGWIAYFILYFKAYFRICNIFDIKRARLYTVISLLCGTVGSAVCLWIMKEKEPQFTEKRKFIEPLHITKRDDVSFGKTVLFYGIGIGVALVLSSLLIVAVTGQNPIALFKSMYEGVIGTPAANIGINKKYMESIHAVAILLCISLAVTPAFKMKFWNIGAEGQVLMGCLASAYCMLEFGGKVNNTVLLIIMVHASVLIGAIWAVIPAICKAFWNTNETLFTLMMNYVAMTLVSYFIMLKDKSGRSDLGILNERTGYGYLPELFGRSYIFNILIVVGVVALMFVYLKYSKQGYEISVVGESENTARYIGINVKKVIIRTVAISGAICGLVGFMIIAGDKHSIKDDIVGGQGFTAIMVSWMAKFNPIIMIPVAMLIIFLSVGSKFATSTFKVDNSIGDILTAIVIFSIIACEFLIRYKVNFRKSSKEG